MRGAERLGQLIECGDDAGREAKLLLRDIPAVMVHAPFVKGLIVAVVVDTGIAQDPAVKSGTDSIQDLRRYAKFHVGNPHTNELFVFVREDLFRASVEDVLAEAVCVQGIGMPAIDDFIKIIHGKPPVIIVMSEMTLGTMTLGTVLGVIVPRMTPRTVPSVILL